MLDEATLERRLRALEQAVADLQRQVEGQPKTDNWPDNFIGSISDEAAFLEAMACCGSKKRFKIRDATASKPDGKQAFTPSSKF